jgi:hypothetical protein
MGKTYYYKEIGTYFTVISLLVPSSKVDYLPL